jgi:hypothetical protein
MEDLKCTNCGNQMSAAPKAPQQEDIDAWRIAEHAWHGSIQDKWQGPWRLQTDSYMTGQEGVISLVKGKFIDIAYTDGADQWKLSLPIPTETPASPIKLSAMLRTSTATPTATASQESAPEQEAVAVSTQEPDLIRKLRGLAAMVESQEGWRPTVVDEAIAALSAPPTSTAIAAVAIKQAATLVKVETRKGNSSGYYFDLRRDVGNFLYDAILKLSPEDAEAELEALITDRCTKVAEAVAKATENPDYSPSHLPFIVRRVLDEKGE